MKSITRPKRFRFGRAVVNDIECGGILESTAAGWDTSIHIAKRGDDEDVLMRQLVEGGLITVPFGSYKIDRAI